MPSTPLLSDGGEPTDDRAEPFPLRVVSVPAAHPYVRSITNAPDIHVLDDPVPPGAPAGQWWPPAALDPAWIRLHARDADLLHIHFGTESFSAEHLKACLVAAREAGWPVIFTLHDISHPQLEDQTGYQKQLDVLVPGAQAVIALTRGAANEIRRRWNRDAVVSPHPALLPGNVSYPHTPTAAHPRIGVHLKDLRTNIDAVGTVRAIGAALELLRDQGLHAQAEIRMHRRLRNNALGSEVRSLVQSFDAMVLHEHDRLNDAELWSALAALDACVLPYRHGTHSGWLELCWDLAVPVVAPAAGFYAEQHTDGSVASFQPSADGTSLARAITTALNSSTATRAGSAERHAEFERRRAERTRQSEHTATMHADLYRRLLAEVRS